MGEYSLHRFLHIHGNIHLALSGLTIRPLVWPWQQACLTNVRTGGVRTTWIFIMTVYWQQCGSHTQVRLSGLPELAREEGGGRGSVLIAHMRDIQESAGSRQLDRWRWAISRLKEAICPTFIEQLQGFFMEHHMDYNSKLPGNLIHWSTFIFYIFDWEIWMPLNSSVELKCLWSIFCNSCLRVLDSVDTYISIKIVFF